MFTIRMCMSSLTGLAWGSVFGDDASMGWPILDGGLDISDRLDVSLKSIEGKLLEESNRLEAKFGRPQLQQIQGSDEFARAWYSMVVMFNDSQLSHATACCPHLQALLQILQGNLGLYLTMLVYVRDD